MVRIPVIFEKFSSLGAALSLGFLARLEGIVINTLLPFFAGIALVFAVISWALHKQHFRGLLAITGPVTVLAVLYLFWTNVWSTYLFYVALALMFMVSIYGIVSPPAKTCKIPDAGKQR